MHAAELFTKLECANEPGADGTLLECVIATPRVGAPIRSCYDAQYAPSSDTDQESA